MGIEQYGFVIFFVGIAFIFAVVSLALKSDDKKKKDNKKKKNIFGSISLVFFMLTIYILMKPYIYDE
tara:strand:- start:55 stop:255 length:201 start_codon:yes stop_codon:yes gene_type:complete